MPFSRSFIRVGLTSAAIALLITSCGETKIAQCNKLVRVINKGQAIAKEGLKTPNAEAMNRLAMDLDQLSQEIQAIQVQDPTLQELQGKFVQVYGELGTASRNVASAATAFGQIQPNQSGLVQVQKVQADAQSAAQLATKAAQAEGRLVAEINGYCQS